MFIPRRTHIFSIDGNLIGAVTGATDVSKFRHWAFAMSASRVVLPESLPINRKVIIKIKIGDQERGWIARIKGFTPSLTLDGKNFLFECVDFLAVEKRL